MNKNFLLGELKTCQKILDSTGNALTNGHEEVALTLLKDINAPIANIKALLQKTPYPSNILKKSFTCCENLEYSLDRFFSSSKNRHCIFRYEILVSFSQMNYMAHHKLEIMDDSVTLQKYRQQQLDQLNALRENPSSKKTYKYKVSICVIGYNKLEYTKCAIESIMKYTDFSRGDIELITINNGSTDGTQEYFESLPHEKKVNYKHNILGMSIPPVLLESQYWVGFSNDVIATPHWLEQLLYCIESSPDIAMVVPTCNEDSISREQGIPVPYRNDFSDMDAMQKFALEYNHTNPSLWEERPLLMPFVSIQRSDIVSLQLNDPIYVKSFFGDDDLSTTLRRTGWRMLLAKDTFLHHFGSITLGKANNATTNTALEEMRKVYFSKWGIDAWESSGSLPSFQQATQWVTPKPNGNLLWIEPKFGLDFLQMKNMFRKEGEVHADAIVLDKRYVLDTKPYFDRSFHVPNISSAIPELHEQYNVIGMGGYLHETVHEDALHSLEQLYGLLKPGGIMLVPVKNFGCASALADFIHSGGTSQYEGVALTFHVVNIRKFLREISQHKFLRNVHWQGFSFPQDSSLGVIMNNRLADIFSQVVPSQALKEHLQLSMMWFAFFRPLHSNKSPKSTPCNT